MQRFRSSSALWLLRMRLFHRHIGFEAMEPGVPASV
jgi:hypothetical protein